MNKTLKTLDAVLGTIDLNLDDWIKQLKQIEDDAWAVRVQAQEKIGRVESIESLDKLNEVVDRATARWEQANTVRFHLEKAYEAVAPNLKTPA